MARVASKASTTVGEVIEEALHDFLNLYNENEKMTKSQQEARRLVRHALTMFANTLGETFTGHGPNDVLVMDLLLPDRKWS